MLRRLTLRRRKSRRGWLVVLRRHTLLGRCTERVRRRLVFLMRCRGRARCCKLGTRWLLGLCLRRIARLHAHFVPLLRELVPKRVGFLFRIRLVPNHSLRSVLLNNVRRAAPLRRGER